MPTSFSFQLHFGLECCSQADAMANISHDICQRAGRARGPGIKAWQAYDQEAAVGRALAGPHSQASQAPSRSCRAGATGPGDSYWARAGGPLSVVTVLPRQTHRSTDTGCSHESRSRRPKSRVTVSLAQAAQLFVMWSKDGSRIWLCAIWYTNISIDLYRYLYRYLRWL